MPSSTFIVRSSDSSTTCVVRVVTSLPTCTPSCFAFSSRRFVASPPPVKTTLTLDADSHSPSLSPLSLSLSLCNASGFGDSTTSLPLFFVAVFGLLLDFGCDAGDAAAALDSTVTVDAADGVLLPRVFFGAGVTGSTATTSSAATTIRRLLALLGSQPASSLPPNSLR
jgi:hypothetical protein